MFGLHVADGVTCGGGNVGYIITALLMEQWDALNKER
jgi:hypothetical protein